MIVPKMRPRPPDIDVPPNTAAARLPTTKRRYSILSLTRLNVSEYCQILSFNLDISRIAAPSRHRMA
jgi:hypothetical protein